MHTQRKCVSHAYRPFSAVHVVHIVRLSHFLTSCHVLKCVVVCVYCILVSKQPLSQLTQTHTHRFAYLHLPEAGYAIDLGKLAKHKAKLAELKMRNIGATLHCPG